MKKLFFPFRKSMKKFCVFASTFNQHKIFNSIISLNVVNMMNNLCWSKISSKMFFHYKTMFKNIERFIVKWMVRTVNINISSLCNIFPTFPFRVFISSSNSLNNPITSPRAIFSSTFFKNIRLCLKLFSTYFTTNYNRFSIFTSYFHKPSLVGTSFVLLIILALNPLLVKASDFNNSGIFNRGLLFSDGSTTMSAKGITLSGATLTDNGDGTGTFTIAPGYTDADAQSATGWTASTGKVILTTSTDNVGMGSTNPQTKLDVNGDILSNGIIQGEQLTSTDDGYITDILGVGGMLLVTGNVGIGTANPDAKLEVIGQIEAGAGSATTPAYGFFADHNNGMFLPVTDTLGFTTAGSERIRIASDGNVGVGSINPRAKLDIAGDAYVNTLYYSTLSPSVSEADTLATVTARGATTTTNVGIGSTAAATNALKVTGNMDVTGNVGVGTITPTTILDIHGDATATATINAVPAGQGGIDLNTKLMLHMDGANNGTTFTDSSTSAKTVTPAGNAKTVTGQKVFGTASGLFAAAGDYLSVSSSSGDFVFTGDFTIEGWIRFTDVSGTQNILCSQRDGGSGFYSYLNAGAWTILDNSDATIASSPWSPQINTDYHVVFTRSGTATKQFVNGSQIGTDDTYAGSFGNTSGNFYIGHNRKTTSNFDPFKGYIDELRISNGIARWTSNFTPPTAPYSSSIVYPKLQAQSAGINKFSMYADGADGDKFKFENGSVRMTIDMAGNTGLGTTTPVNKLDVYGGQVIGTTYAGSIIAPTNGLLVAGNTGIGTASPRTNLDVIGSIFASGSVGIGTTVLGGVLDVVGLGTTSASNTAVLRNSSKTALVTFQDGGNVGIGTSTPIQKLDVRGSQYLSGNLGIGTTVPTNILDLEGVSPMSADINAIAAASSAPACDAFTSLLLHADGLNGGTTFTDENCNGSGAKTPTVNGNINTSTTSKKFGTASIYSDGVSDYLAYADNANFDVGSGDWNIDMWVNPSALPTSGQRKCITGSATCSTTQNCFAIFLANNGGNIGWRVTTQSAETDFADTTVTTGNWYYLKVNRTGGNITVSRDGVVKGSPLANSTNFDFAGWYIGGFSSEVNNTFNGYIDEFRFSKGSARETAYPFSPPTSAWNTTPVANASMSLQVNGNTKFSAGWCGTTSTYDIANGSACSNQRVSVTESGNVGINTTSPQYKLEVDGTLYAGSVGGYTTIEADGSIYSYGNATWWDDLQLTLIPAIAVNAPTYTTWKGGRVITLSDEAVNEDQVPFTTQFPHSYRFGSTVDFHAHIVGEDTTSCNFRLCVDYAMADINKAPATGTVCKDIANLATQDAHNYADISDIAVDTTIYGGFVSTAVVGKLYRNSTSGNDTCNSKNLYLLGVDMHLERNTIGSRTETGK